MDEGFDYGIEYGDVEPVEPSLDSGSDTGSEWNDDFAEANELIDSEPESIEDDYIEEYNVTDLLDPDQGEEYPPEEYPPEEEESTLSDTVEGNPPESDTADEIPSSENLTDWIGDINPNFDEFDLESPYSNNCGSCAYAVYQRLEGNPDSVADAANIPYNSDMEALTGMEQVSMSPQEIEKTLLDQGAGAHAIIGIDRAEGPGHWFNAVNIDGVVKAVDGQTGEIRDWPPDYGDVVNWEMSVKKETVNG